MAGFLSKMGDKINEKVQQQKMGHSEHGGGHQAASGGYGGSGNPGEYKTVAYFVNWAIYGRNHQPQDLPADKLTHVLYSFANVRPESGEVYLTDTWSDIEKHYDGDSWNDPGGPNVYGCLKQLALLKQKHRNFKTLLSIGGWTYSSNFAPAACDSQRRQHFAKTSVRLLADLGFDGIDIDWEYPTNPTESQNFVELLRAVREELHAYASRVGQDPSSFLLTVACPAGPSNFEKLRIKEMDQYLDFWNLMAYDYAGSWDSSAGHQANLYPSSKNGQTTPFSTLAAVDHYMRHGLASSPHKIVIGCPLYGRAFTNTKGPGHGFNGVGEGSWENGVWDYKDLPRPNSSVHEDEQAIASYCQAGDNGGTMVSYDTPRIAKMKADYIASNSLGGVMWWESSGDKKSDPMIATMAHKLGKLEQKSNTIEYPESKYENLRKGFR